MNRAELLEELYGPAGGAAESTFAVANWLASSRRFAAFTEENLPKIRKKLRTAPDAQSLAEVLFELEAAYHLLDLKAVRLEYEPFAGTRERGPDFMVWHGQRHWFLLEVTRLSAGSADALAARLTRALLMKLRQLRSGTPNVLLLGLEDSRPSRPELAELMAALVRRVEVAEPEALVRLGLRDKRSFFKEYERLALLLVRGTEGGATVSDWDNPRAKYPLASNGRSDLLAALGGASG